MSYTLECALNSVVAHYAVKPYKLKCGHYGCIACIDHYSSFKTKFSCKHCRRILTCRDYSEPSLGNVNGLINDLFQSTLVKFEKILKEFESKFFRLKMKVLPIDNL
jgi:hypothetical protein